LLTEGVLHEQGCFGMVLYNEDTRPMRRHLAARGFYVMS